MFTFIIGAVVGLALFLCLRYCLDTPSPCGMGFDFDECPCCTVLPEIIFPEHGKYAGSSYQQNLSTFLGTYRDYLRLSKKYRDVAQIDSEAPLTLFAIVLVTAFAFFAFPAPSRVLRIVVGVALSIGLYVVSGFVYRASPLALSYRSVETAQLRKSYDYAASRGYPITYEELDGLCFEPESFDPFLYHVLKKRVSFMQSVMDSLIFRRKLLKVVGAAFAVIYLLFFFPTEYRM